MVDRVEPVLSFSTLACPEWSPEEVIDRAATMGYGAIEWRGGPSGHLPPAMPPTAVSALRLRMHERGVEALALTTYGSLVAEGASARHREADDLRRDLDLAAQLGAAFVRVFVGIPERSTPDHVMRARAVEALRTASDHARDIGVGLAVEPHDLHVRAIDLRPILDATTEAGVGVIWELENAWRAGEDPDDGLSILRPWIRYVQLRDARRRGDAWEWCRIGDGEVPVARAVNALAMHGPLPPLSVEWPRSWDDRLEPANVVLPAAIDRLRAIVADVAREVTSASHQHGGIR